MAVRRRRGSRLLFRPSRLTRNGRDWHHLLELCGLVKARVIDLDGVYNPWRPNDRLLLGMKGSISEFELGVLRAHARRRPFEGPAGRTTDFSAHRLHLASGDRLGSRSRREGSRKRHG